MHYATNLHQISIKSPHFYFKYCVHLTKPENLMPYNKLKISATISQKLFPFLVAQKHLRISYHISDFLVFTIKLILTFAVPVV